MAKNQDKYYYLVGDKIVVCRDVFEWAKFFKREDRLIAKSQSDDIAVSTVFLGIDHSFDEDSEPLLFETMIFGGEHDNFCDRHSSKKEAIEAHNRIVKKLFGRNVITEKVKN